MLQDVREYIDRLQIDGHTIGEDHDDDPILIDPSGTSRRHLARELPVRRADASREDYDEAKYLLQVELLKFQRWTTATDGKHVLLFEGRDAAGKGGTIKRFMEHLNPRYARTVALGKPQRPRAEPVVLPALRPVPADRRRDGALRPVLVQPRGRRAGDGLRYDAGVRAVHGTRPRCSSGCWSTAASR